VPTHVRHDAAATMARFASSKADTAAPSCKRSEVPNARLYSIDANRSTRSTRAIGGMLSLNAHLQCSSMQRFAALPNRRNRPPHTRILHVRHGIHRVMKAHVWSCWMMSTRARPLVIDMSLTSAQAGLWTDLGGVLYFRQLVILGLTEGVNRHQCTITSII
jgi:hypothetical protein